MSSRPNRIHTFELQPGRVIGGKYVVRSLLGAGWEGEVYKVEERRTGAMRAAKVFFPQRNPKDRALEFYARKLERLNDCPLVIQYHHSEEMRYRGLRVTVMISEYVQGRLLERLVREQPGRRLGPFESLTLLRALAAGLAPIHARREYHGDLHAGNVLVRRRGVHFDVKAVDFFNHGRSTAAQRREDVLDLVRLLYDISGGARRYRTQPPEIKAVCRGLRRDLVLQRFPTVARLRDYLDEFAWERGA